MLEIFTKQCGNKSPTIKSLCRENGDSRTQVLINSVSKTLSTSLPFLSIHVLFDHSALLESTHIVVELGGP